MYKICNNAIELIAGTDNRTSPLYIEAAKSIEADTPQAMGTMKNFITSIEKLAAQENVQDARISGSQGNISRFVGYENIKYAINFLSKNLSGLEVVKELTAIFRSLEAYQAEYINGYEKQVRLIILEYEAALYMLVTGLSFAMANNIDIQQTGTQIRVVKKGAKGGGSVINKTISDLAKQLEAKDHQSYLKELINARLSTPVSEAVDGHLMKEAGTVGETLDLFFNLISGIGKIGGFAKRTFQTLKRTMFGIIPMIRTALYLRYKKKADTILSLEQQIAFVKMNIEQLENIKTMDETQKREIIMRQKAAIEGFQKRAEKLRAELVETERDAATSLKTDEPELNKEDDEFVLENSLDSRR